MIQTDARDYTDDGVDDVGGVEPPARSNLHHGDVDLTFSEPPVSEDAPDFGIADWQLRLLRRKETGRCVQYPCHQRGERASVDKRWSDLQLFGRHL